MQTQYLVTASGTKDGKSYMSASRVVVGTKANGDRYCFLDDKAIIREETEIAVGTVLTYETKRITAPKANA